MAEVLSASSFPENSKVKLRTINGPTHLFDNQSMTAVLADGQTGTGPTDALICEGFEPNLWFLPTEDFVGTFDVETSPNGKDWVARKIDLNTPDSFGRNDLGFPIYAVRGNLKTRDAGSVKTIAYAERRK